MLGKHSIYTPRPEANFFFSNMFLNFIFTYMYVSVGGFVRVSANVHGGQGRPNPLELES